MTRPRSVVIACWLVVVAVVLSLAVGIPLYLDDVDREVGVPVQQFGAPEAEQVVLLTKLVGGGVTVGLSVLYLLLVLAVWVGWNWARIALAVLVAFGMIQTIGAVAFFSAVDLALSGTQMVLVIAATVLLFRADAHPHFDRRASRAGA